MHRVLALMHHKYDHIRMHQYYKSSVISKVCLNENIYSLTYIYKSKPYYNKESIYTQLQNKRLTHATSTDWGTFSKQA